MELAETMMAISRGHDSCFSWNLLPGGYYCFYRYSLGVMLNQ